MNLKNKININKYTGNKLFIFLLVFLLTFIILVTSIAPKRYNLSVGDISSVDIKAPIEIIDEKATEDKIRDVISKVDKQYTLKSEVEVQGKNNIQELFSKVSNLNSTENEETYKITTLRKIQGFNLNDSDYKILLKLTSNEATEVGWYLSDILTKVYESSIEDGDEEQLKYARNKAYDLISQKNFPSDLEFVLIKIVDSQIKPNFFYDKEKTEAMQREAQKNVPKETIKKGQIIVSEGEPITDKQLQILKEIGYLDDSTGKGYLITYMMLAVYILVVLFLQYLYLYKQKRELYNNNKMILMISIINLVSLLLARGITLISPFLIPLAFGSILITLLIDNKVSVIVNTLNILLLSVIFAFSPQVIVISIVSVLIGAMSINKLEQRNDIIYSSVYIGVINLIICISTGLLLTNNFKEVFISTGFIIIGAFLSGILAVGFLPLFETLFDAVTNVKLLELSNPNHPLLKRLLMEAPGTYHHSIMVANLAEVAAEQVGGNSVIARIGAYYHDVGKIKRPYFFGENQIKKENPHDKITPNLSTLIITSHTKDGVELAKEYNIPKVIQDIIEQHHGTTLVKYFYYTMKNNSERPEEVKEEDFMYPGPTPSSKEAAIIMLADSVEAAVRSIQEPTKGKIEEMVNNIIKDKLNSGQLINCELTFKDIEIIRKSFLKVITGIYHQRIEYPTEKSKK